MTEVLRVLQVRSLCPFELILAAMKSKSGQPTDLQNLQNRFCDFCDSLPQ
jgi:hypothetical protein